MSVNLAIEKSKLVVFNAKRSPKLDPPAFPRLNWVKVSGEVRDAVYIAVASESLTAKLPKWVSVDDRFYDVWGINRSMSSQGSETIDVVYFDESNKRQVKIYS